MKALVIIAHPKKESFSYNGVCKTIQETVLQNTANKLITLDLYAYDSLDPMVTEFKENILWADVIYFVSPVWWFRCTPKLEEFFDKVFVPGFAYNFKKLIGVYGMPQPLLSHKKVRTYLSHGAPALPVLTLYVNSVKLRLVMGVYSFVFGWFRTKTRQFWSVPFVSESKRKQYLETVKKDVLTDSKNLNR